MTETEPSAGLRNGPPHDCSPVGQCSQQTRSGPQVAETQEKQTNMHVDGPCFARVNFATGGAVGDWKGMRNMRDQREEREEREDRYSVPPSLNKVWSAAFPKWKDRSHFPS